MLGLIEQKGSDFAVRADVRIVEIEPRWQRSSLQPHEERLPLLSGRRAVHYSVSV